MKTLLAKEFRSNWRSFRFPALLLVFLFFALLDPVSNKYMHEIIAYFAQMEFPLPDPSPQDAFFSFLSSVSQIGILVLIFVTMGIVAKEKESGVAGWMLSKPVGRWNYLAAKVISIYAVVILGLGAAAAVAYLYTWLLLGPVAAGGALWATVSLIAYTLFIGSITFFCSTVLKSPLQAGGVAVLVFFTSGALQLLVGNTAARSVYPNTLLSELVNLVYEASGPAEIAGPLAATLFLSLLLIFLAGMRFSRAEL